jgi:hypothetical protein
VGADIKVNLLDIPCESRDKRFDRETIPERSFGIFSLVLINGRSTSPALVNNKKKLLKQFIQL